MTATAQLDAFETAGTSPPALPPRLADELSTILAAAVLADLRRFPTLPDPALADATANSRGGHGRRRHRRKSSAARPATLAVATAGA
jgi:hypothetical protein